MVWLVAGVGPLVNQKLSAPSETLAAFLTLVRSLARVGPLVKPESLLDCETPALVTNSIPGCFSFHTQE